MKDPKIIERENELMKDIDKMSDEDISSTQEFLNAQQKRFDRGVELAEKLANFMNSADTDAHRGFLEGMKRQHRTLQQSVFGLFCEWAAFISNNYQKHDVDLRNEGMVKAANEITKLALNGKIYLPFI